MKERKTENRDPLSSIQGLTPPPGGVVPQSGLGLKPEFSAYDAEMRYGIKVQRGKEPTGCLCGDVIKGKTRPTQCPMFGKRCTPDHPVGPCMVSSEGTCSAYFKYGGTL